MLCSEMLQLLFVGQYNFHMPAAVQSPTLTKRCMTEEKGKRYAVPHSPYSLPMNCKKV